MGFKLILPLLLLLSSGCAHSAKERVLELERPELVEEARAAAVKNAKENFGPSQFFGWTLFGAFSTFGGMYVGTLAGYGGDYLFAKAEGADVNSIGQSRLPIFAMAGAGIGAFGAPWLAARSKVRLPPGVVQGKSPEYIELYTRQYERSFRKRRYWIQWMVPFAVATGALLTNLQNGEIGRWLGQF